MGAGQSRKITSQERAILDLKLQRDKLKQYQRKIEGILEREKQIAREALAADNKSRALTALRRRKYQEGLLSKTDSQLETLQNLVSSIEFSLVEKDVMFGLQQGNSVLKELHKEMTVENVEKLMGETDDAVAYQNEVSEMLSSRMSAEEEDAVQKELAALQAEQEKAPKQDVRLPDAPKERPVHMPSAPTEEPSAEEPEQGSPSKETGRVPLAA